MFTADNLDIAKCPILSIPGKRGNYHETGKISHRIAIDSYVLIVLRPQKRTIFPVFGITRTRSHPAAGRIDCGDSRQHAAIEHDDQNGKNNRF
jgi:hypothetical protein